MKKTIIYKLLAALCLSAVMGFVIFSYTHSLITTAAFSFFAFCFLFSIFTITVSKKDFVNNNDHKDLTKPNIF